MEANHSDWLVFVAAVVANPDDDLPRLLAADFLDEIGTREASDRAAFIRVGCAIAGMSVECPKCKQGHRAIPTNNVAAHFTPRCRGPLCRLLRAEQRLLVHNGNKWADEWFREPRQAKTDRNLARSPYPENPTPAELLDGFLQRQHDDAPHMWCWGTPDYRRGFPSSIKLPMAAWMEWGPKLVRAMPLESVRTSDREPCPDENSETYDWWDIETPNISDQDPHPPSNLPNSLFVSLADGIGDRTAFPGPFMAYDTPELAHAALSAAVLKWARSGDPDTTRPRTAPPSPAVAGSPRA